MVSVMSDLRMALSPTVFAERCGIVPDPWQREVLESSSERVILLCSRQAGKSLTAAMLVTHRAIYMPDSLILLIAPTRAQSGEMLRTIRDVLHRSGIEATTARDNMRTLEFVNGSRIVIVAADSGTLRGYSSVDVLLFDEVGWIGDDVVDAASPMLAISQGRTIMLSTPNGARGRFYETWEHGSSNWHRVSVTADQVSRIDPDWLALERERLPESVYQSEYLCQFTEASGAVFREEDIEAMFRNDVEAWTF
jgi:hypothetical protein